MTVVRIQMRRGTTAQWNAADPVLAAGEWGAAIDDGQVTVIKLGDGVTAWTALPAGAADGADGLSAYDLAVADGYTGSLSEWLASLVGAAGGVGPPGPPGVSGDPGPIVPLSELTDVTITAPDADDTLIWNGVQWVNRPPGTVSAGAGVSWYPDAVDSGIGGYDNLTSAPAGGSEVEESVSVNNGSAMIDGYITGVLGRTTLDAGVWEFDIYTRVSNTSGTTTITVNVYKRSTDGVEALLFSAATPDINDTILSLQSVMTVQPAHSIDPTDRVVVKYVAATTRVAATTVYLAHNGTSHYSHIHTPLAVKHNDLAGLQGGGGGEMYHLTSGQVSDLTAAVPSSRQVSAGTGLSGGGDLTADRSLAVSYGSSAGTAAQGNDSRLSDARTPTSHAASHGAGQSDAVTLAQSQITNLTIDLAAKVPASIVDAKGDIIAATADDTVARLPVGADGARLLAAPDATPGVRWVETQPTIPVNNWFASGGYTAAATATGTQGRAALWPFLLPCAMTISECSIYVSGAAGAGALWRLGFYAPAAGGVTPGALIADLGTIDPTGTGLKTVGSLSVALPQGLVWGCLALQGSGTGTGNYHACPGIPLSLGSALASGSVVQHYGSGVTGALPDSAPSIAGQVGTLPPVLILKRSA